MAAALPILLGASTAFQVVGSMKQGQAAAQAGELNALMAERNAGLAREQAAEEERTFRVQTKKFLGGQRAAAAASGAQVDSFNDVMRESAAAAELDALKIRYGGELKAAGLTMDAQMNRQRASASRTAGYMNAAGYLLSGAGDTIESGNKYWTRSK